MKPINVISLIIITGALNSCSLFEPASPVGSYIHIDSISISTEYTTQGSNSSRITDAWIFYDNAYLGTFPLPADIPLIGDGNHAITVKAGIMENGIAASRAAYPKYTSYYENVNLIAGKSVTIKPQVTYGAAILFPQIEDFDDASLSLVSTTTGTIPLSITPANDPNAFEGNSGFVILDSNHPTLEVASSTPLLLPLATPTYLELDYKTESDFVIGIFATTTSGILKTDLLNVRATQLWKKIYLAVSDLGGVTLDGLDYKIYIHADKPSGQTTSKLYFDNLKVVY